MCLEIFSNAAFQVCRRLEARHFDVVELVDHFLQSPALFEFGIDLGQQSFIGDDLLDAMHAQLFLDQRNHLR